MAGTAARFKDRVATLQWQPPVSQAAGTVNMTSVDLRYFDRIIAHVMVGVLGASATVDFKFQGSPDNSAWTDIDATNCKIPQITTTNNQMETLELMAQAVVSKGYRYARGVLVVGTAATLVGVLIEGIDCRYAPASNYDIAAVTSNVLYIA